MIDTVGITMENKPTIFLGRGHIPTLYGDDSLLGMG